MNEKVVRLAVFCSGAGSNALAIFNHLAKQSKVQVVLMLVNKQECGAIGIAQQFNIPSKFLKNSEFLEENLVISILEEYKVEGIILAGFLRKIPGFLIDKFVDKILNIHPSLLPKFGGKGMYGHFVHQAVIQEKEKESGITIHLVNENYDEGSILFQAKCKVEQTDTVESLAKKIHKLEHEHFPKVIETYFLNLQE